MTIQYINWDKCIRIGGGGNGQIHRLAPDSHIVAKVGRVRREEASLQRMLAEEDMALPVLEYVSFTEVPRGVAVNPKDYGDCNIHGLPLRDATGKGCGCTTGTGVLLMPFATPIEDPQTYAIALPPGLTRSHINEFCTRVQKRVRWWDADDSSIALYEGHLVALDLAVPHE